MAYAADFVSFVLQRLSPRELQVLKSIVLFGSAARGDTHRESDVDLILETEAPELLESKAQAILEEFELSVKVSRYWKPLGVTPHLSLKVGELSKWTTLHPALLKDGRVLYGPFRELTPHLGQAFGLLSWKDVDSVSARTNLYRSLHGYASRGHRYPGMLAVHGGQRIAKGAILVPLTVLEPYKALFRRLKIPVSMRVLYEMGEPEIDAV